MKKSILTIALAMVTTTAIVNTAEACTYINFKNELGNTFTARAQEWPGTIGDDTDSWHLVPRGHKFTNFPVKYGYVSSAFGEISHDGLNEHGLQMSMLQLDASKYAPDGTGDLSNTEIGGYILGNFKTVDEVEAWLKTVKIHDAPIPALHGARVGLHYVVTDNKRSIVVEFTDGKGNADIYKNTLGVMANDPTYDVQMSLAEAMLDNGKKKFSEMEFAKFDMSSVDRFKKMAALNYTQDMGMLKTDYDGILRAWSIGNTMDTPQGVLYWRHVDPDVPQSTTWTTVTDIANKRYFLRTYTNQVVQEVDLDDYDFSKIKYQKISPFEPMSFRKAGFKQ